MKTKTVIQVCHKIYGLLKQIASNPKHKYAQFLKVLKKLPLRVMTKWTDQQTKRLSEAVQKQDRTIKAVMKYIPEMKKKQIEGRIQYLKRSIETVKNHPYAHLKKPLQKRNPHIWSKKEETAFIEMFKKYGKDYKQISAKIPTKTHIQVSHYGIHMYYRIQKNPRHRHKTLFKKLKPHSCVRWTAKEYKLLLKGLQKHIKCQKWI